jgi:hypothetical protein
MRARIRSTKTTKRRVLPERSRHTVRRTVVALQRSREALVGLESQLDELLGRLRMSSPTLDSRAGERLAVAKNHAVAAMAGLAQVGQIFG